VVRRIICCIDVSAVTHLYAGRRGPHEGQEPEGGAVRSHHLAPNEGKGPGGGGGCPIYIQSQGRGGVGRGQAPSAVSLGARAVAEVGARAVAEVGARAVAEVGARAVAEVGARAVAEVGARAVAEVGARAVAEGALTTSASPKASMDCTMLNLSPTNSSTPRPHLKT